MLPAAPALTDTARTAPSTTMVLPLPVTVSVSASMPDRSIVRFEAVISMLDASPWQATAPPVPAITSVSACESSRSVTSAVPAGSTARTDSAVSFEAVSLTASAPLSTTRPSAVTPESVTSSVPQANTRSPAGAEPDSSTVLPVSSAPPVSADRSASSVGK